MLVSTKGRYAIRVMIDLAEHANGQRIPLKEIARRQGISQKYMEGIMAILSKAGMVDGLHGKGGGYRLNQPASSYRVSDILLLTEGTLSAVACLAPGSRPCPRAATCRTLSMWKGLDDLILRYFEGITVADLAHEYDVGDYVI
ncbi:MAG: Rrf2 family transcriptional regulator [Sphaerochaetaceae bacterium]|nr:Rrf2 family transcriptional regulator [Sphaerochaetaceae bacterium]